MGSRFTPQEIRQKLTGPIASIRTPFNCDGSLDLTGLRRMVDFSISAGSEALMVTHGDSLFSLLTDDEVALVNKTVTEHTSGRAIVCAATDIWNTGKSVDFAQYCRDMGSDLLMVLPPDWGHSCTVETLAEHYAAVANHIPVMVVTNVFIPRGIDFGLQTVEAVLRAADGVIAVKDDMGNDFARKLALLVHDHWAVIAGGQKQHHLNMWPYGCDAYLSTFITFKPEIARKYWQAIQSDNLPEAQRVVKEYDMPYFDYIIKLTGGFDAGMHGVYELFGLAQRWRRKPYYSLNDEEMAGLSDFLKQIAIL